MNDIKLSVIVPIYNTEKYLRQCLDSILGQTLKEIEVICVDDGSTDSSPQILREYCQKDCRIRIITKVNDGLGAARNTGIWAARGEYVGFVDSDDFIDVKFYEYLYQTAIEHSADVVLGNINLYYDDTGKEIGYQDCLKYEKLIEQNAFSAAQIPGIVERIGVWDRIYKRSYLLENNLFNPEHVIYEDALFSFQTSILAGRISLCSNAVYKYRKNTGIAITDKEVVNDKYKFDFIKSGFAIKDFLQNVDSESVFSKHFLRYFITNALWHQSNFVDYKGFEQFYYDVIRIVGKDNLIVILQSELYSWKSKVYSLLLRIKCPFICYSLFFYKRFQRKRR